MATALLFLPVVAAVLGVAVASPAAGPHHQAVRAGDTLDLTLVHVNDMHARYEETSQYSGNCAASDGAKGLCYGGYARVATLIKAARAADAEHTLVLNAGDNYQGTIYYTVFKWNISAHFNNWLSFDATTLGNHEFDDHVPGVVPYIKALTNPLVVANLDYSAEPTLAALNIPKSVVLERAGVKIGVVGYLTPDTAYLSSPDGVTFSDEVAALQEETQRLKKQGVNIFIGLGHSGYEVDKKIAAQVPEIDLVVGGHSHSFLYTGHQPDSEVPVGLYPTWITQTSGKKVPVVQAYAFTKYLGQLLLSFDADGNLLSCVGKPALLNKDVAKDPETLAEVNRWKEALGTKVLQQVGQTEVTLDASHCRQQECNIGNLITDSAVRYAAKLYRGSDGWTNAPISLTNSGVIRETVKAGKVTIKDVMEVLPFDNLDVLLTVNGSVLRSALEHSVAQYVPGRAWQGQFLQYSGVHVTYDVYRPVGSRVVSAEVRCGNCSVPSYSPLDDRALYTIIVNSYLASGGDGFTMLASYEASVALQDTDSAIFQAYIKDESPVYAGVEGRITFVSSEGTTTAEPPTSATATSSTRAGNAGSASTVSAAWAALLAVVALFGM